MPKSLTVVVPVHNEEESLPDFYRRAETALSSLDVDWKILFVNDASDDDSLKIINSMHEKNSRVRVITLSRNFGYNAALVAGLSNSESDIYAIIDVDCEDPPEMLKKFHAAIGEGFHTVYGIRSQRPEPQWLVFFRWLFYWINNRIADGPTMLWMAEFSMFTRTVRDAILSSKSTFPFLRAEMGYVGLRVEGIPYVREARKYGVSHYNVFTMAKFAFAGFLASSTFPLRFVSYLSGFVATAYLVLVLALRMDLAVASQLAVIFSFGYLLVTLPVLSLYMARTYKNVSARPVYFMDPDRSIL